VLIVDSIAAILSACTFHASYVAGRVYDKTFSPLFCLPCG